MGVFRKDDSGSTPHVCPAIPGPATDPWTSSDGRPSLHKIMMIVGGAFAAAAISISIFNHLMHATHFSSPREQTKIMRIIFFVPALAIISWGSIALQLNAWYLTTWSFVFEAFALASFFMLVCDFISPDAEDHPRFFDQLKLKNGKIAGSAWFYHARRAVFQYTPISIIIAIATDATLAANVYCVTETNVHFAKLWLTIIKIISTGAAVGLILLFVLRLKSALHDKGIMSKLVAFKFIVLLETLQNFAFSFAASHVTPTDTVSYADLTTGLPGFLLCIESLIASLLMLYAYSWKPYTDHQAHGEYGNPFMAIMRSLNILDAFREFAIAFKLIDSPETRDGALLQDYDESQRQRRPVDLGYGASQPCYQQSRNPQYQRAPVTEYQQ